MSTGPFLYVPNEYDNAVSVIDTSTNSIIATIPVMGQYADTVAVSPNGAFVYVASESGIISVVSTASNSVVTTVTVGSQPYVVAFSPDGSRAYVTNHSSGNVSVIDTATDSVVANINVGSGPYGVAVSPDGTRAYVTNENDGTVSVIDTTSNSVLGTLTVGSTPTMVALSPDGTLAYVNNHGSGTVSVIGAASNSVIATISVGSGPYGVVFSPDGSHAYVANDGGTVSVISTTTNSVTDTISVGEAVGIAISPDGSKLYVSHYRSSNTVTVIDTSTNAVTGTINVGNVPEYLAISQLDNDANEQAALSLTVNGGVPIGALIAGAVPFTVGGLEADDSGTVAFSDGSHAPVVVNIVNGVPVVSTANLSGLTDGPITATLHLNSDAAGNSFTDVVASATLDQDTNDQPTVTLAGLTGGNAVEGTAVIATVSADDLPSSGITYTWQASRDGGATWTPIPGATSNSYTPTELDEGGQLQVQVSFTDPAGNNETGTATVLNVVDAAPTLSVAVNGIAQEGQTLSATPTLGTDSDNTTADVTYQWERNGTAISGATGSTYVVGEVDEGAQIQAVASFTDDTGQSVQATSNATGTVLDAAPTVTTPTISGAAQEGGTLTASANAGQADNNVTYQWFTSADGYTKAIGSGATYQVQEGDESHQIEVVATAANDNGLIVSATSTPTSVVVDVAPTLSVSIISNHIAYTTIDPPGSRYTIANSINASRQIVGLYQDSNGQQHGFLDSGGTYTTIDPPGSIETIADSINASGQVVGTYFDSSGTGAQGFLYSGGTYTTIDPPGSNLTGFGPTSINASGEIVGYYRDGNDTYHGFVDTGGTYTTIDPPGSKLTDLTGINVSGQIVGVYEDSNGQQHGFLDSGGIYTTIGPPGSLTSTVTDINDSGQIVGFYTESNGGLPQGFLYSDGTYTTLNVPGELDTLAYSINNSGQIVGFDQGGVAGAGPGGSGGEITSQFSFLYSGGTYTTIDPAQTGAGNSGPLALSINASGQIVGYYYAGGTDHGFLAVSAATEGSILTATPTTNDADATVTYQWQVLNGSTWANIKGATSSTYLVTEANEGHQLRVIATSSDPDGGGTSATSAATAVVTDVPPSLSVTLSGTAQQGQVLIATANATSDGDGGKTTYQWQELVGSNWVAISGATHSTYTVAEAVEGFQVRVLATFTDDTGQTVSATSPPTTPVLDVTPTLSVTVTGTAQEGQKLTAHPLVTSDGDGGATTYQWQKLVGTTWTNITGATASTYQVGELDEGYQMRVAAAFTDDTGQIASATSAATASVIDIKPTLSVTVSGVAQEGQTLVATAIANDSDASVGYQWQQLIGATWTNITGAMGSTYAITEANEGNRLRVVATSSDSDGSGTSATSIATASVTDPPPMLTIPIPSLFVAAGGSVSLPLSVSGFDSDDKVSVIITGLPTFETITDNLDKKSFSGSSVTLSAAEVNSGLTLHSSYGGTGQPVNVLTVTAANTTPGEGATSAAQTITVTDPPVSTTLASAQDHTELLHDLRAGHFEMDMIDQRVALLSQYMASAFATSGSGDAAIHAADPTATTQQQTFLAPPQHVGAG